MLSESSDNEEIQHYVKLCQDKKNFHHNNAVSATKWNNFFQFIGVLLTSATALSMTVLTVLKSSDVEIAVIGGVFAFASAVTSRIQENYGFRILNYQHSELSNNFQELENSFLVLSKRTHNRDDFEKLTIKYLSINARTNIMNVRHCYDIFCFN